MRRRGRARIRILFVYSELSSFIRSDLEILKRNFDVRSLEITTYKRYPFNVFKLLRWILWADIVYSWFAGTNAFFSAMLSALLRKKSLVVAGGYDAAYVPEIDYGIFTCWWRSIMAIFVYRNADLVLAVSNYTKKELLQRVTPRRIRVIYNAVDTEKFTPLGEKKEFVLTVGAVNELNLKKKGLETFVEAAKFLPEVRFVLVGKFADNSIDHLKRKASENVEFAGHVSFDNLLHLYRHAAVYAQLSYHESFGLALAEAMSCGCIPVLTERAAIPEVAGDCGIYVPYDEAEATAKAIRKALKSDKGLIARERIEKYFSIKTREKRLVKEILDLTKS